MTVVVLDTHVAIWWAADPARLSRRARARIEGEDALGIPAIVYWEVALLVRKGRVELGMPARSWVAAVEAIPRVATLPLTAEIAVLADELEMHPDPADRFIVATARCHGAPLISKDRLMRSASAVETVW